MEIALPSTGEVGLRLGRAGHFRVRHGQPARGLAV